MSPVPEALEPYLPTLDKLRRAGGELKARIWWRLGAEVDLLGREPDEMLTIAAIIVSARVVRRDRTAITLNVSAAHARDIPEEEPGHEPADLGRIRHVLRELVRGPHACRCHQGMVLCVICRGDPSFGVCPACEGLGKEPCAVCGGEGVCITVKALSLQDQQRELVYAYLPNVPFALEHKLQSHIEAELKQHGAYPDALTIRLERRGADGPYREVSREPTSFYGYAYGSETVKTVRNAIARLRGEEPLSEQIGVWARPILWLRYHAWGARREVAVISDPTEVRAFVTDGGV